jgi:hypothetical protein
MDNTRYKLSRPLLYQVGATQDALEIQSFTVKQGE